MSLPDKAFPVSWDQFHRDARALAWRLADGDREWKAIVCITRGGLVPAAVISRELNIRLIETVCVASYHDYVSQGDEAKWLKSFGAGLVFIEAAARDESTQLMQSQASLPIRDPKSGEIIGAITVGVNMDAL